jgi:hypothetical protein
MITQFIYKIRKGANLSRTKWVGNRLFSDNIKAPKTITLYNKHLNEFFMDDQIDEEFYEFKHKTYGKFIVHALDLTITERKI